MPSARLLAQATAAIVLLATTCFLAVLAGGGTLPPRAMEALLLAAATGGAVFAGCAIALTRGWFRWLWLLSYPLLAVLVVIGAFMFPTANLDQVRLADGRVIHLVLDAVLTDTSYSLWKETAGGMYWRRIEGDLTYSEDGRFVGDERLVLSHDNRRLLVSRGGIWTDCISAQRPDHTCGGTPPVPDWRDADFEHEMRRNSQQLASLL